jgi:Lrp/AsnC family transcriptional regulator for asnA, asnC and gidA
VRRGEFDALDQAIVRLLQENGRRANSDIARELSVTEATIRARLAQLLDDGWIEIVAVPTAKTLTPKLSATLRISTRPADMEAVAETLATYPEIRYVAISDRFEILLEAYFRDRHHMYEFIVQHITPLPSVTRVATSVVLRILKYTHEWDLTAQSVENGEGAHVASSPATGGGSRSRRTTTS